MSKPCLIRYVGCARRKWKRLRGPIPEGYEVCHTCDNERCAEMEHLFLGTHRENMQDCIRKGRFVYPKPPWGRGEKSHLAKLSGKDVKRLRRLSRTGMYSTITLGKMFGIGSGWVSRIARKVTRGEVR